MIKVVILVSALVKAYTQTHMIAHTTYRIPPQGHFPNNDRLDLIVYPEGLTEVSPEFFEELLISNGWGGSW